jgi:hypothetical protein
MVDYKYPGPIGVGANWGYHAGQYPGPIGTGLNWSNSGTSSSWIGILDKISEGRKLWLEFQKTMTGSESLIAAVLRSNPAKRVNFSIDRCAVNKPMMENVADAIEFGSVRIQLGSSGLNYRAGYTRWLSHKPSPGTTGRSGRLTVRAGVWNTEQGKIDIFHESVHALKDILGWKINRLQDEAIAFLADTLFWLSLNMNLPSQQKTAFPATGDAAAIYDASRALVKSKDMLAKPGTALRWSECATLIKAIKEHPDY